MIKYAFLIVMVFAISSCLTNSRKITITDHEVLTQEDATKIAIRNWRKLYGNNTKRFKPYIAELRDSIWVVQGSLNKYKLGGTPYIEIQKNNGAIIKITHYK